jgi:hypothetical protein
MSQLALIGCHFFSFSFESKEFPSATEQFGADFSFQERFSFFSREVSAGRNKAASSAKAEETGE